jgi:hypothetical protein
MRGPRNATLLATAAAAALALGACGGGGSDDGGPPAPPPVGLTTGEAAQVVIGQAGFTDGEPNRGGAAAANTLSYPRGNPAVVGGRLYLSDYGNNRVLAFDGVPTANGASADLALGQVDLVSSDLGLSAAGLDSPDAIASDGTRLVVADADNGRVLVWNAIPAASGVAAAVAVGKPDLDTGYSLDSCDASTTSYVQGVATAGGKLVVADTGHHRVLVWNAIPTSSGQPADLVLGQADLGTCDANAGGLGASSLSMPQGVWTDGTRLLVVDSGNARVLVWNGFPAASGAPADLVLGQADLSSAASAVTAAGLAWPASVASNGTQIAVADCGANRVLVWNAFPAESGASAHAVLGQADFGSSGVAVSATGMSCPAGVLFHEDRLLVAEWDNSRYLVFR